MGGKPLSRPLQEDYRTKPMMVRITQDEHMTLVENARKSGFGSMAEYVRYMILNDASMPTT